MSNEITGQMKHKNKRSIEFVPMKMNKVNIAKITKVRCTCNKCLGNVNFQSKFLSLEKIITVSWFCEMTGTVSHCH